MILSGSTQIKDAALGATRLRSGEWQFVLWAPHAKSVDLHLLGTRERFIEMEAGHDGYHFTVVDSVEPGVRYLYRLDGARELPDPASRYQPEGVHGPSQLVDTQAFNWSDRHWAGLALEDSIL